MYTFFMVMITSALAGQIVGMRLGWAWSRHIGNYTTRHWGYMGFVSGFLAWLYFHWIIAMIWSPGLTARVVLTDLAVFTAFFCLGAAAWHLREAMLEEG